MYFEKVCEELCPFPQDEYKLLFIFFSEKKQNKTKHSQHLYPQEALTMFLQTAGKPKTTAVIHKHHLLQSDESN